MWDKFSNWMGQGQNQDLFSVLAGGAGAAIAGPDTWQGRLGNFAGSMGQSGIQDAAGQESHKRLLELITAAMGGAQPATQGAPAAPGATAPATQNMGELFSALGPAGVTPYSQQLGAPASPSAPAPTQATSAAPAAPGGGQSSDPFVKPFFQRW